MSRIGDPTFEYHTVLTQIWGLTALRLANSDILPFDFAANGAAMRGFLGELERRNKITQQQVPLKRLYERIAEFEKAGGQLREAAMRDLATGKAKPEKMQQLNEELLRVESNWLDPAGYKELASTFLLGNESSTLWHWRMGFRLLAYPGSMRLIREQARAELTRYAEQLAAAQPFARAPRRMEIAAQGVEAADRPLVAAADELSRQVAGLPDWHAEADDGAPDAAPSSRPI